MDYWKLIKRAWHITGKYKFLWFFGLFLGGSSLSSSFNGNFSSFYNKIDNNQSFNIIKKGEGLVFENIAIVGIVTFIVIAVLLVMVFLKTTSQGAIIVGVNEIEETGESNFSKAFKSSLRYFWKILVLQILSALLIIIGLAILGLPVVMLFILNMSFRGFILALLAIVIFIPLVIIISFTSNYASRIIVINKEKLIPAIKIGFNIFKDNLLVSILISIILFAINAAISAIILITLLFLGLLFGIPLILIGTIIHFGAGIIGGILLIILGILIIGVLFIFIGAILNTFKSTLWTLVYRELTHT